MDGSRVDGLAGLLSSLALWLTLSNQNELVFYWTSIEVSPGWLGCRFSLATPGILNLMFDQRLHYPISCLDYFMNSFRVLWAGLLLVRIEPDTLYILWLSVYLAFLIVVLAMLAWEDMEIVVIGHAQSFFLNSHNEGLTFEFLFCTILPFVYLILLLVHSLIFLFWDSNWLS